MDITQRLGKNLSWMGLFLPLVAVLALGWLSYRSNATFTSAFDWVAHSYQVLNQIERVRTRVTDIENSQRGYLLTGRKEYLPPYTNSVSRAGEEIKKLEMLASDNPVQQKNVGKIQSLITNQLSYAEASIQKRTADLKAALPFIMADQDKNFLGQIRGTLAGMRREETRLLVQRQQRVRDELAFNKTLSFAVVGIVTVVLVVVRFVLYRIEKLQNFITVCAWTGQVKYGGKWIRVDEYLNRRFGASISHGLSQEAMAKMKQELQTEDSTGPQ
jgi:CHASE3 domain sensor protein